VSRCFAIRNARAPDALIRQSPDGGTFAYANRRTGGEWIQRSTLIDKIKEWNVDAIGEAEAAAIAMRLGVTSVAR
jgi:hypothetical protein